MPSIKERIALVEELHKKEVALMAAKSNDYSGADDCNRNILACERIGLCDANTGLLVRLLDKFQRLVTLLNPSSQQQVKDESIEDTISDARNYLAILAHVRRDAKATPAQ